MVTPPEGDTDENEFTYSLSLQEADKVGNGSEISPEPEQRKVGTGETVLRSSHDANDLLTLIV